MPRVVLSLLSILCVVVSTTGCGGGDDDSEEACGPLTSDAVAYFKFDTCADGTAPESNGAGFDANLRGEAGCTGEDVLSTALASTWSSQAALNLDGEGDFAEAPDAQVFEPAQLTVSAWVYSEDYEACGDSVCTVVSKGNINVASNGYNLMIVWGGFGPLLRLVICADGVETAVVGTTEISPATWHHVAATYDGNMARVYLDGEPNGTAMITHGMTYGDENLLIGAITSRNYDFLGQIDDVALFDYAKTDEEVAALYASYVCP